MGGATAAARARRRRRTDGADGGDLLEMDGQKAMVIRRRSLVDARGKLERDTRVMQSREEEEERELSRLAESNRCRLGEMREERGDDDDERRSRWGRKDVADADWVKGANGAR